MSYPSFPIHHANPASPQVAYEAGPGDRSAYSAFGGTDDLGTALHFTADHSTSVPSKNIKRTANKGIRTRSGCYTCRIRRKKCDEKRDAHNQCETCARLHVQCLGFGDRRPDWLKDTNLVKEMRKKIKEFLNCQGHFKGAFLAHGGLPARDFLWLYDEGHRCSLNPHAEDESLAATQPSSPLLLRYPFDSMAIATESTDAHEQYGDIGEPYSDSMLYLNSYYLPRDATPYSVDPLPWENTSSDGLGNEPDDDSQYSFQSGSTRAFSVDNEHRTDSMSAESGLGNTPYHPPYRFTNNTPGNDRMIPINPRSSSAY